MVKIKINTETKIIILFLIISLFLILADKTLAITAVLNNTFEDNSTNWTKMQGTGGSTFARNVGSKFIGSYGTEFTGAYTESFTNVYSYANYPQYNISITGYYNSGADAIEVAIQNGTWGGNAYRLTLSGTQVPHMYLFKNNVWVGAFAGNDNTSSKNMTDNTWYFVEMNLTKIGANNYLEYFIYESNKTRLTSWGVTVSDLDFTGKVYIGISNGNGGITGGYYQDDLMIYEIENTAVTTKESYNNTLSSLPNNISTNSDLNISINSTIVPNQVTNMSTLNPANTIWYSINTTLNGGCAVFYQKTCAESATYINKTMTLISNTSNQLIYQAQFTDEEYYGGYYPFNYPFIDKSTKLNDTVYSNNNIMWNISNMSTVANYYINLEFNARNKTNVLSALLIYYCNSSYYNNVGNPALRNSCELIDSFTTANYDENHASIPVVVRNVTKTQQSYIIFVGNSNQNNGWYFAYVLNSSYDNSSFKFGNFNAFDLASTYTNKIYDVHLHQFSQNDSFRTYSVFRDSNGTTSNSTIKYLYFNITYTPPSAPDVITPNCSQQYTLGSVNPINISWTQSSSQLGYNIFYGVLYTTNDISYNLLGNTTNTTLNLNSTYWNSIFAAGTYRLKLVSYDGIGSDYGLQTCTWSICSNNWQKSNQPCINNVKLISYEDDNNCNELFNLPSDNATYEDCIVPATQGETDLKEAIYVLGIIILICMMFIYLYKKGE